MSKFFVGLKVKCDSSWFKLGPSGTAWDHVRFYQKFTHFLVVVAVAAHNAQKQQNLVQKGFPSCQSTRPATGEYYTPKKPYPLVNTWFEGFHYLYKSYEDESCHTNFWTPCIYLPVQKTGLSGWPSLVETPQVLFSLVEVPQSLVDPCESF